MNVHFDPNELGLSHLGMGDRLLTALLGYAVVFAGLMVLMAIVYIMGSIFNYQRYRPLSLEYRA